MNEQQYLKTIIETIKYEDDLKNKNELLTILRNSIINYERTGVYGGKSNYFREYVCLRVPIPLLKRARELEQTLEFFVSEIYMEPTDTITDYEYWGLKIKPKPIELDNVDIKEHDVVFDEIKDTIIQGIREAKYVIWVAVAWFSDNEIYEELFLKKQDGVNIRIIISDEKSNEHLLPKLKQHFEVVVVPLRKGERYFNRLHDKFCIIDLEYVMHGSYNWSINARKNDETLATALDRDFVKKFADEFVNLFKSNKN